LRSILRVSVDALQLGSDPGLHAACEWLLRRWQQQAWLTKVNETWAKDKEEREKRLEGIGKALARGRAQANVPNLQRTDTPRAVGEDDVLC
jgi:hypothetical protein